MNTKYPQQINVGASGKISNSQAIIDIITYISIHEYRCFFHRARKRINLSFAINYIQK